MAGGQSAQRRGNSSQGPANPKKAQAKGKSRSPRGKGGGSAGGDRRGEGGRGRGSSTTPTPKTKEGCRSRQVSRQPKSSSSQHATPRLAEASCDPVGFRRGNEETPVVDLDSDHHEEEEVVKPRHPEEEQEEDSDEKFRRVYLEQLKLSVAAFKEREAKERRNGEAPGGDGAPEPDEGGRGEGSKENEGGGGGEGARPFFPAWEGTQVPLNPQRYQRWSQGPEQQLTSQMATSTARTSSASTATMVGLGGRLLGEEGRGGGGGEGGEDRRVDGEEKVPAGDDRVEDGGLKGGRGGGGGRGKGEEGGKGKGGGKVPIAKPFPKPRPAPIVTDPITLTDGMKDVAPTKRG